MRTRLLFPAVLLTLLLLASCSSGEKRIPAIELQSSFSVSSAAAQEEPFVYENMELGFSFSVPQRWSSEHYSIVVTHGNQEEDGSDYSRVTFYFQNDKDAPLLSLCCVKEDWWRKSAQESAEALQLLGEREPNVFCFSLPSACTFVNEEKEALYREMQLTADEVAECFTLMGDESVSYEEGVVIEAAMHSLVLETEDGRQLSFSFDEESSAGLDGLLLGDTIRVGYRGEIDGEDTRGVTVVSLETVSRSKSFGENVLPSSAEPVPIDPSSASAP